MVVWRQHGTNPPAEHLKAMHTRLRVVAAEHFGPIYIDEPTRNIPDRYPAHGRPVRRLFGRDFAHRPAAEAQGEASR
jgi:hypothetical protein